MKRGDLIRISSGVDLVRVESHPGAFFTERNPSLNGLVKHYGGPLIGIFCSERNITVPVNDSWGSLEGVDRLYYEVIFSFGVGWVDSSFTWVSVESKNHLSP